MLLQLQRPTIAVVITNHNYNDFLPEALESVTNQTLKPKQIIVVDDSSDISCETIAKKFGCVYIKTDCRHPLHARKFGFIATTTDYICFLDADDKLPPEYLAKSTAVLSDENIDIAYSDIQKFGDENKLVKFPEDIKPERLWQTNFLHVGCVVSRDAIILSQAFDLCPNRHDYHEDWMFWRHIVATGFKYKKHNIPYMARIHDRNRSKTISEYTQARAVKDGTYEWYWDENWHKTIGEDRIILINRFCRQTTADYIGFGHTTIASEQNKPWITISKTMAQHLDHDIDAIYDKHQDNILFVGPVIRNTILRKQEIERWPIKIAIIPLT